MIQVESRLKVCDNSGAKEAVGVYGEKAEFLLQLADFILARRN